VPLLLFLQVEAEKAAAAAAATSPQPLATVAEAAPVSSSGGSFAWPWQQQRDEQHHQHQQQQQPAVAGSSGRGSSAPFGSLSMAAMAAGGSGVWLPGPLAGASLSLEVGRASKAVLNTMARAARRAPSMQVGGVRGGVQAERVHPSSASTIQSYDSAWNTDVCGFKFTHVM
jgi:hypothetical protein